MKSITKTKAERQREYELRTGYAAQNKYRSTHIKQFPLQVNIKTESDILEKLQEVPNRQGYIKQLIRQDIERNK